MRIKDDYFIHILIKEYLKAKVEKRENMFIRREVHPAGSLSIVLYEGPPELRAWYVCHCHDQVGCWVYQLKIKDFREWVSMVHKTTPEEMWRREIAKKHNTRRT